MNGLLWQPEHEFVLGPDTRLKLRGKMSGAEGSESWAPVPLLRGLPPPSSLVHMAVNSCLPKEIRSRADRRNSWPSWRCTGIAASRPIFECVDCEDIGIPITKNKRAARGSLILIL